MDGAKARGLSNQAKRTGLFLFGCLVVRSLFVLITKYIDPRLLPYLGALALLPVFSWLWIYFVQPRETGPEVFGGKIWWNHLRPVHAILYSIFAILAFQQSTYAYVPLLVDVVFGASAFAIHRLSGGE